MRQFKCCQTKKNYAGARQNEDIHDLCLFVIMEGRYKEHHFSLLTLSVVTLNSRNISSKWKDLKKERHKHNIMRKRNTSYVNSKINK